MADANPSDVELGEIEFGAVGLDELPPRGHLVTHQDCEDAIGFGSIFNLDPLHRSGRWIHGGFPELLGHHFAQALETLDCVIGLAAKTIEGGFEILLVVAIGVIFTALHFVERRAGDVDVATFQQSFLIAIEEGE